MFTADKRTVDNWRCGWSGLFWSSSQNNNNNAWNQRFSDGNQNNNNKNNTNSVRAVRDFAQKLFFIMKKILFEVPIEDIFSAYYDCRQHKRNKAGALNFEIDSESNLIELWNELQTGTYKILPSTVFIVEKPIKREIFAANFRDRIVHHLLLMYLNPYFEKHFIYDTYSCRVGKGTHFGINRINHFIHKCSNNGKSECWILKLDVQSFFMSIDKRILYKKLIDFVDEYYKKSNVDFVKYLLKEILWNNPTKDCIFHSPKTKWDNLRFGKSLFDVDENHGLPIGNFTSQVFANFYLSKLDHFIKHDKKIEYYGRYVDDFVIVHKSRETLRKLIREINDFIKSNLGLQLSPKKIYLQPYHHGVRFLGTFIKQNHIIANPRIYKNFKKSIYQNNQVAVAHKPSKEERNHFISSMNSYLGILKHYKTYNLRSQILKNEISELWLKQISIYGKSEKIIKK